MRCLPAALAPAVIVMPIVVRTTEDMLWLVPVSLHEASAALGAPKWRTITLICYRAMLDGITTGVLLAVARVAGETAPLLFTSFGNQAMSLSLGQPMASLPVTIYQYAGSAFDEWVDLACAGAWLINRGRAGAQYLCARAAAPAPLANGSHDDERKHERPRC